MMLMQLLKMDLYHDTLIIGYKFCILFRILNEKTKTIDTIILAKAGNLTRDLSHRSLECNLSVTKPIERVYLS